MMYRNTKITPETCGTKVWHVLGGRLRFVTGSGRFPPTGVHTQVTLSTQGLMQCIKFSAVLAEFLPTSFRPVDSVSCPRILIFKFLKSYISHVLLFHLSPVSMGSQAPSNGRKGISRWIKLLRVPGLHFKNSFLSRGIQILRRVANTFIEYP